MDKEFELTTKTECYLKVSNNIEDALGLVYNLLAGLRGELNKKDLVSKKLDDTTKVIAKLYNNCNTDRVFNLED